MWRLAIKLAIKPHPNSDCTNSNIEGTTSVQGQRIAAVWTTHSRIAETGPALATECEQQLTTLYMNLGGNGAAERFEHDGTSVKELRPDQKLEIEVHTRLYRSPLSMHYARKA